VLQISELLAQKIITLRDELGGYKEPQNPLSEMLSFNKEIEHVKLE